MADLSDRKLLQLDRESVDSALSAYEKGMFESSRRDEPGIAHDNEHGSLSYLFAIFR